MAETGKTSVNSLVEFARSATLQVGKSGLHMLAPDNFEYYMCSLELLDSQKNTQGFLSFVVMPNNILESRTQIVNITKTSNGVASIVNTSFIPRDISIQGTFGRKFRLLLGMKDADEAGNAGIPFFNGNLGFDFMKGDVLIRTGYGLTKMLKNMIEKASQLDRFRAPHILLFRNYALNTHYVVEVLQDSYSQSVENNMLWYYSLEMKAIAPASSVFTKKRENHLHFFSKVSSGLIAKGLNDIFNDISKSLNAGL